MNRSQTIAEIIDGQPGTFVYDEPFWLMQAIDAEQQPLAAEDADKTTSSIEKPTR